MILLNECCGLLGGWDFADFLRWIGKKYTKNFSFYVYVFNRFSAHFPQSQLTKSEKIFYFIINFCYCIRIFMCHISFPFQYCYRNSFIIAYTPDTSVVICISLSMYEFFMMNDWWPLKWRHYVTLKWYRPIDANCLRCLNCILLL